MNRDTLLKRLNWRATSLYRAEEITPGILDDWLEAKIITAPDKRGRTRDWTSRQYRRALEIVRLKSQGTTELREIGFHLWTKKLDVPFLDDQFRDRKCLLRCFVELRNELTVSVHSTYPYVRNTGINKWPAKSVIRNLGTLDASFAGIVNYEPSELLATYRLVKFGDADLGELNRPLDQLGRYMLGFHGFDFRELPNFAQQIARNVRLYLLEMSGLFDRTPGSRKSVDRSILEASPEQYEIARRMYHLSIRFFWRLALKKVARSLLHPKWRLAVFVLCLHLTFRLSKYRQPVIFLGLKELDFIEANFFS